MWIVWGKKKRLEEEKERRKEGGKRRIQWVQWNQNVA